MLDAIWRIYSYGVPFLATFLLCLWLAGQIQGSRKLGAVAFVAILAAIVVFSAAVSYSVNTVQSCQEDC